MSNENTIDKEINEIFKKYDIKIKNVEITNKECAIVTKEDGERLFVKVYQDKDKIAWEYKCLITLFGKITVPKIYKHADDYIPECIVLHMPDGKFISTYEDKQKIIRSLGSLIASLHIVELNEQRSGEELKKIWKKFILNKALYCTSTIMELLSKEVYDKIVNYLTETIKVISDDFELSMIIGNISNEDVVISDDGKLTIINFSNSMIGDPMYDIAKIYNYLYFDKEMIEQFNIGYEEINSIPEDNKDNEKFNVFIVLEYLDKISTSDKDKDSEQINKYIEEIQKIVCR